MSQHTPGPWWAGTDEDAHMVYGSEADGTAVADCMRDDGDDYVERANARLIAAAPDLLAACKVALDRIGSDIESPHLRTADGDQLRAAVAKAEGR